MRDALLQRLQTAILELAGAKEAFIKGNWIYFAGDSELSPLEKMRLARSAVDAADEALYKFDHPNET